MTLICNRCLRFSSRCEQFSGHCPHDEKPEEVNSIIQEWVATVEGEALTVGPKESKSIREVI